MKTLNKGNFMHTAKKIIFFLGIISISFCSSNHEKQNEKAMDEQLENIYQDFKNISSNIRAIIEITDELIFKELYMQFDNIPFDSCFTLDFSKYGYIERLVLINSLKNLSFDKNQNFKELVYIGYYLGEFHSIKQLKELKYFECNECNSLSGSMNLNSFPEKIQEIRINNSKIDSFYIPEPEKYAKLHTLHLHYNFRLHYIDTNIYHLPNLKSLTIACTEVKNLNFSKLRSLQNLSTNKKYKHTKEDLEFFKKNNVDISRNWSSCISF